MSGRITILNVFWINQWIIDDCHKTNGEDYKNCSPGSFWLYIYFKKPYCDSYQEISPNTLLRFFLYNIIILSSTLVKEFFFFFNQNADIWCLICRTLSKELSWNIPAKFHWKTLIFLREKQNTWLFPDSFATLSKQELSTSIIHYRLTWLVNKECTFKILLVLVIKVLEPPGYSTPWTQP